MELSTGKPLRKVIVIRDHFTQKFTDQWHESKATEKNYIVGDFFLFVGEYEFEIETTLAGKEEDISNR